MVTFGVRVVYLMPPPTAHLLCIIWPLPEDELQQQAVILVGLHTRHLSPGMLDHINRHSSCKHLQTGRCRAIACSYAPTAEDTLPTNRAG